MKQAVLKYSSYLTVIKPNSSLSYEFLNHLWVSTVMHNHHLVLLVIRSVCLSSATNEHSVTRQLLCRTIMGQENIGVKGYDT